MNWREKKGYEIWLFWQRLRAKEVFKSILSVFGAIWLLIEILAFFNQESVSQEIKSFWWFLLILGLIIIIYRNWPKSLYTYDVLHRDVSISIKIGDIFAIDGALIIPINNRLDCENNGIIQRSSSILNFFIRKKYNGKYKKLQKDINESLSEDKSWYSNYVINKKPPEYKIGTVVPIFKDEKQYYFTCSSSLNSQNRSKTTEDDLRLSLTELWSYLTHSGSKDNLVIPILGTGRGRITMTREEVIKEIVLSFLVSLSADNYCEQLTICIHPKDLKKYNIKLQEILDFINLQCNNTNYKSNNISPDGTAIS
jgi:hypothetical protein